MNSVELIAVLKENIDDRHRYVEYALPTYNDDNKNSQILVARYWSNQPLTLLNKYEVGRRVAIRGHLDAHEKFGTIVIVETLELL